MTISLREFANWSEQKMLQWFIPRRWETIKDDRGEELQTDTYKLAINWYGLLIHRDYGDRYPYLLEEVSEFPIVENKLLMEPIETLLQRLMPDVDDPFETDQIKQRIYEWQIKLNNFLSIIGQGGEISASATDVEEVISDPEIMDIKERLNRNEITTDEAEDEFKEVILHSETLPVNSPVMLSRTGGVSVNQGFQTMIRRGSVFDLNNQILPNQVKPSFAEGIVNAADALGENRGAGKALNSNGKALEDSEWFHRKLHITAGVIMKINYTDDCGTDRVVPVKLVDKAQAISLVGKTILKDNEFVLMTNKLAKEFHRGDTVYMRSVAYCEHGPGTPCGVCYGKLKASLPYNVIMWKSANPGLYSATEIAERIGQALLSTKHFLRHTTAIPFVVDHYDRDVINTDGDYVFLNKDLAKEKTELILDAMNATDLADFKGLDSLEEVNEDQLRTFATANLRYVVPDPMTDGESLYDRTVGVAVSSRSSRMSMELIEYAIKHGWERNKKRMTIDLSEWNPEDPLFFLPYVHEDLSQYQKQIESFLLFKGRNEAWLRREITEDIFGETLSEFWGMINRKFKGINIVHPEIMLSMLLTKDPENGFYGLPEGRDPRYFTSFIKCIENRGMGGLYIFQGQTQVLERYATYSVKGRSPSLMEADIQAAVF